MAALLCSTALGNPDLGVIQLTPGLTKHPFVTQQDDSTNGPCATDADLEHLSSFFKVGCPVSAPVGSYIYTLTLGVRECVDDVVPNGYCDSDYIFDPAWNYWGTMGTKMVAHKTVYSWNRLAFYEPDLTT